MKLADSVMAGKTSEGSIKWQLCYDISARTWWMVSWHNIFFFFFFLSFFLLLPSFFFHQKKNIPSSSSLVLLYVAELSETQQLCVLFPKSSWISDALGLFVVFSVSAAPSLSSPRSSSRHPVSRRVPAQVFSRGFVPPFCCRDTAAPLVILYVLPLVLRLINRKLL